MGRSQGVRKGLRQRVIVIGDFEGEEVCGHSFSLVYIRVALLLIRPGKRSPLGRGRATGYGVIVHRLRAVVHGYIEGDNDRGEASSLMSMYVAW